MRNKRQWASEDGFTLLEMLIAVIIMAIGLLGMAALQGTAMMGNNFGGMNTEATALVMDKIEEYGHTPYGSISEGTTTESNLGTASQYTRATTVQFHTPINDVKTVTVTVSWTSPSSHSISFQTLISK